MHLYVYFLLPALFYAYVMARYLRGWRTLPEWEPLSDSQPRTFVTVIVPARNEAAGIGPCLASLLAQQYPEDLFEIIVVDDFSTDGTAEIAEGFGPRVRVVRLSDHVDEGQVNSFKKKAIETGIGLARGSLIACTDADCTMGPAWLPLMAGLYEVQQPVFIAAPVNFHQEANVFERFQSLDFLGMMGVTGAGIHGRFMHMCNGANLAYAKDAFREVGGFAGIDGIASGDDMLLLQKMARRFPGRIAFLRNRAATVFTRAKPDLPSFLSQRIRWASKSGAYPEWFVKLILAMTWWFCCNILLTLLLLPWLGPAGLLLLALQVGVKAGMDWLFLSEMARYFGRRDLLAAFVPAFLMHVAYVAAVGFLGIFVRQYTWKGRVVR